jgi:hypothetical protein
MATSATTYVLPKFPEKKYMIPDNTRRDRNSDERVCESAMMMVRCRTPPLCYRDPVNSKQ